MGARGARAMVAAAAALCALLAATGGNPAPDAVDGRLKLTALRAEVGELQGEVSDRRAAVNNLEKDADQLRQQTASLAGQLGTLAACAGDTALTGPGVEIVLSDAPRERLQEAGAGYDINWFLVHDRDLLRVLNVLKSAGAEALSVNGVRLSADTAVHCGGPAIYLEDIALTPPFLISAIGDPAALEKAITGSTEDTPSDVYLELVSSGLVFEVRRRGEVRIPSNESTVAAGNASRPEK